VVFLGRGRSSLVVVVDSCQVVVGVGVLVGGVGFVIGVVASRQIGKNCLCRC